MVRKLFVFRPAPAVVVDNNNNENLLGISFELVDSLQITRWPWLCGHINRLVYDETETGCSNDVCWSQHVDLNVSLQQQRLLCYVPPTGKSHKHHFFQLILDFETIDGWMGVRGFNNAQSLSWIIACGFSLPFSTFQTRLTPFQVAFTSTNWILKWFRKTNLHSNVESRLNDKLFGAIKTNR